MHTLDDLDPQITGHDVVRYRKHKHSSSSEMARGALRRTNNMREGMKLKHGVLTRRQEVGVIQKRRETISSLAKRQSTKRATRVSASVHHPLKEHPTMI